MERAEEGAGGAGSTADAGGNPTGKFWGDMAGSTPQCALRQGRLSARPDHQQSCLPSLKWKQQKDLSIEISEKHNPGGRWTCQAVPGAGRPCNSQLSRRGADGSDLSPIQSSGTLQPGCSAAWGQPTLQAARTCNNQNTSPAEPAPPISFQLMPTPFNGF